MLSQLLPRQHGGDPAHAARRPRNPLQRITLKHQGHKRILQQFPDLAIQPHPVPPRASTETTRTHNRLPITGDSRHIGVNHEPRLRDRIRQRPQMVEPIAGNLQSARSIRGAIPTNSTCRRLPTGHEHHPVSVTKPKPVVPPRQRHRPIPLRAIAALVHGLEPLWKTLAPVQGIAHKKEPRRIRLGQERRRRRECRVVLEVVLLLHRLPIPRAGRLEEPPTEAQG